MPALAVAMGATFVEKHITFDRKEKGEDYEAALDPNGFKEFVENIRAAEKALGTGSWGPLDDASAAYRSVSRKGLLQRLTFLLVHH